MAMVHGTCIDLAAGAVLLRGPSGSGKSDLALRLIDGGARLIADDQVCLERRGSAVQASAPAALSGLIEVRGVGLLRLAAVPAGRLVLVVDLVTPAAVERLPEPASVVLEGVPLPLLKLAPFQASACAKLRLAVAALSREAAVA